MCFYRKKIRIFAHKYTKYMISFDQIDLILLDELQRDSKQSVKELAKKVNLSITPVHERIKKLEALNVIQNYVAVVNPGCLREDLGSLLPSEACTPSGDTL